MLKKTIIISSFEPQYVYFFDKYKINELKNVEYYFVKQRKISPIKILVLNIKKSINSKKIYKLIMYYVLLLIFKKKYSSKYKILIKNHLNKHFNEKKNLDAIKLIKNLDEINIEQNINYDLILFGSDYVSKDFYTKFKNTYNIHFGLLPKYRGLRATERMYLDNILPHISVNALSHSVDSGKILYLESVKQRKFSNYLENIKLLHELSFEIVYKLIHSKLKLLNEKNINKNLFFGFEFNELMYKKLLKKINDV